MPYELVAVLPPLPGADAVEFFVAANAAARRIGSRIRLVLWMLQPARRKGVTSGSFAEQSSHPLLPQLAFGRAVVLNMARPP